MSLREVMDRLFEEAWVRPTSIFFGESLAVPVDVIEKRSSYYRESGHAGIQAGGD